MFRSPGARGLLADGRCRGVLCHHRNENGLAKNIKLLLDLVVSHPVHTVASSVPDLQSRPLAHAAVLKTANAGRMPAML